MITGRAGLGRGHGRVRRNFARAVLQQEDGIMGKVFYSSEEAAAKLNLSTDKLEELVAASKLREFRDGNRVIFKVDEIDRLAAATTGRISPASASAPEEAPIGLAPHATPAAGGTKAAAAPPAEGSSAAMGALGSLAGDSSTPVGGGSTGIPGTGAGVKIFDEDELKPADPAAQTHISEVPEEIPSPSGLEAVGSGSGLLDLTREADNTSLGAELLEEIYPSDQAASSKAGITPAGSSVAPAAPGHAAEAAAPAPTLAGFLPVLEREDPLSGLFGGLALASLVAMGVTFLVGASALAGFTPAWVATLAASPHQWIFAGLLTVTAAVLALAGWFLGRFGTA